MKGNVKKILAAVLALTLVLSVAGCKKDQGLNEDGTYTVVWVNNDAVQKDQDLVIGELNKMTKEKIGVVVDYSSIAPAEYSEKTQLLFSSRKKMDLCFTGAGTNFASNARQSAYIDMGKVLDTVGKPTKELLPEYALDCFKVGGIQYGIPVLKDWAFQPYANFTRKFVEKYDLADEVRSAKSLSELTPVIDTVHAGEAANFGGNFYGILMRGNHNLLKFLPQETIAGSILAGFKFDNYDTVINVLETEEAKEFYALVRDWYKKGYIKNDAATSPSDSDLWKIGNYLAGHGEFLPGFSEENETTINANNLTTPRMATTQISACGMAIPSTTKNAEKTMEFINLLYTDYDVRELLGLGIKGKHWVETEDGKWTLPEGAKNKTETGWESAASKYGNRFLLRPAEDQPADIWEQLKKFNDDSIKSKALGFSFDPAPVAGQIAAVQNAYNEYMPAIIVGAIDPETALPEAIKAMDAVGARDIIKEVQRQYDEWKKINK